MTRNLVTSAGISVQLTRELGRGGEGAVFEVPALSSQVAKVYHKPLDAKKQAKLKFMSVAAHSELLRYCAWPRDTLHQSRGGPVVGFLMPKVSGRDPVHMVYSPAHRRQERPKAAWDFLLFVARNTAAAFETLHSHGHVLGDVNQGNVMVGGDSNVVLIDCDSFQVNARGTSHLCEVGVSHFTPPELQSLSSFDGFTRTPNHDAFGLALLIFHLLFGGRHPYSGVPLRDGVGDALESDIKGFRYAYARDAQSRGIAPPPRSIPIGIVPDSIQTMFHEAFTEAGALCGRPMASKWVSALDRLRGQLRKCTSSSMHVYSNHLTKCPWCALEQEGVLYFIDYASTYTQTATGFVLAKAWGLVEAVAPPAPVSLPNLASIAVTPQPLPSSVPGKGTIVFYRVIVIVVAFFVSIALKKAWFIGVLAGWAAWAIAGSAGSGPRGQERTRRLSMVTAAQHAYNLIVEQFQREAGPQGFVAKRAELFKIREEYQVLPEAEKKELDKLHSTAQERQKQKFLDGFFIDGANIPGVGPARKAALRSFGIETAADVGRHQVRQVKGFGEGLTRAVMDWRASCERKFTFNPLTAVSVADKNAVRAKYGARKLQLEGTLTYGAQELQKFKQNTAVRAAALRPQLETAARQLAQAKADLKQV